MTEYESRVLAALPLWGNYKWIIQAAPIAVMQKGVLSSSYGHQQRPKKLLQPGLIAPGFKAHAIDTNSSSSRRCKVCTPVAAELPQSCPCLASIWYCTCSVRQVQQCRKRALWKSIGSLKLHCQDYFWFLPFLPIYKSTSLNYHQENYTRFARSYKNLFKWHSAALLIVAMAWFYSWIA